MADGALHPGTGRIVFPRHTGIQLFGHGIDNSRILYRHDNAVPQIVVPLDMGGHPDLMKDLGNADLQRRTQIGFAAVGQQQMTQPRGQVLPLKRLQGYVRSPRRENFPLQSGRHIGSYHNTHRQFVILLPLQGVEHTHRVQTRHEHFGDQRIWAQLLQCFQQ